jgi:hypothetical protein
MSGVEKKWITKLRCEKYFCRVTYGEHHWRCSKKAKSVGPASSANFSTIELSVKYPKLGLLVLNFATGDRMRSQYENCTRSTFKSGIKQGLECQTRAQTQGDFIYHSNM